MELDAIWQAFAETGDPVCYMLYKAAKNDRPKETEKTDLGDTPQVSD